MRAILRDAIVILFLVWMLLAATIVWIGPLPR